MTGKIFRINDDIDFLNLTQKEEDALMNQNNVAIGVTHGES